VKEIKINYEKSIGNVKAELTQQLQQSTAHLEQLIQAQQT